MRLGLVPVADARELETGARLAELLSEHGMLVLAEADPDAEGLREADGIADEEPIGHRALHERPESRQGKDVLRLRVSPAEPEGILDALELHRGLLLTVDEELLVHVDGITR